MIYNSFYLKKKEITNNKLIIYELKYKDALMHVMELGCQEYCSPRPGQCRTDNTKPKNEVGLDRSQTL